MKIYTRTGDDGTTSLYGGRRVSKAELRVCAYGTIDEANSSIGLARAYGLPPEVDRVLDTVQRDLFVIGAELASGLNAEAKLGMDLVDARDVERLEQAIDAAEQGLAPLRTFILPGGSLGASALHLARTVARRAERELVRLREQAPVRPEVVAYVNRLSDLLFVLARRANSAQGVSDVPWVAARR
jgi:cob(I)alamin adenosyltransferase